MKCVFILPYFGKFKNYFSLFLRSCSYNKEFKWLLITDNYDKYDYPDNFEIIHMSFEEFKTLVQSKFELKISLDTPYKLCDYKPAYGYICEQWINEYDYWGHCDCDLLFGDLHPLSKLLEEGYDKLFVAGHLTIYRNTYENNRIFMSDYKHGGKLFKRTYTSSKIFAFDEVYYSANVHRIFEEKGLKLFCDDLSYNTHTKYYSFCRVVYNPQSYQWDTEKSRNDQIYWENGHVYRIKLINNKLVKEEFLYVHLQMRKMINMVKELEKSLVIKIEPNSFIPLEKISGIKTWKHYKKFYINKKVIELFYRRAKGKISIGAPIKWRKPWKYNPYIDDNQI